MCTTLISESTVRPVPSFCSVDLEVLTAGNLRSCGPRAGDQAGVGMGRAGDERRHIADAARSRRHHGRRRPRRHRWPLLPIIHPPQRRRACGAGVRAAGAAGRDCAAGWRRGLAAVGLCPPLPGRSGLLLRAGAPHRSGGQQLHRGAALARQQVRQCPLQRVSVEQRYDL